MRGFIFFLFLPFCMFSMHKPIIVLDGGHGGKDRGAKVLGLEEKKLTLRTAYLTKKHLEEMGYKVVLTRSKDIFISLDARVSIANKRPSSLFVSIHYNSAMSPTARGIEAYYYGKALQPRREKSRHLAKAVMQQIIGQTNASSRGIKQGNFQVVRETHMPGVLIEAGFLTNKEERALLSTKNYLEQLAKGIALGIHQYVQESTV